MNIYIYGSQMVVKLNVKLIQASVANLLIQFAGNIPLSAWEELTHCGLVKPNGDTD